MNFPTHQVAIPLAPSPVAENERRLIDAYSIGPRTPYERDSTICDVFERQVRATPHAAAIIDDDGSLSYSQVDEWSSNLAQYLRRRGCRAGTFIGVLCERSRCLPIIFLGILKAGCAYVPLDASYPDERIRFIIGDAQIPLVIRDDAWNERCFLDEIPNISFRDASTTVFGEQTSAIRHSCSSHIPAYVMYTSGSTGRPKGVVVPHRAVVRLVRGTDYFASGPSETFLQFAPAAFDASTFEIWGALLNGSRLAIPKPGLLSIDELGTTIERFGVTSLWLTASIFQRVVEAELSSFGGLRQLLTGGSAGSAQHMIRFLSRYPACRLIAGYGPTENTTFSTTYHFATPESVGTNPPIGRPIANSTAYVVNEALEPVSLGEIGELCVGGDGVALGYLNLPAETAARFVPDHLSGESSSVLYRTGDRARMRADGIIEFLGRFDDQVKIHGYRIELGEVESALRTHPDVRDAAVIAVEYPPGEKVLEGYVVPADHAVLTVESVRQFIREKLPSFMLPPKLKVVSALPTYPSGKIDRVALAKTAVEVRAKAEASQQMVKVGGEASTMSRALLTRAVSAIWCEVVDHQGAPDIHVNFFDAGGDSIRLLKLQALLSERLNTKLSVLDIFEHTTIAQIVKFIAAGAGR